jgi:hypothetical protein
LTDKELENKEQNKEQKVENNTSNVKSSGKKDKPTPKRSDAQKRNFHPIVMDPVQKKKLTKEEKQAAKAERKQKDYENRVKVNEAYKSGDERYLPVQDKGKIRKFVRNWVDSKTTFAQFFLPVLVLVLIASIVLQSIGYLQLSMVITLMVYIIIVLVAVELFVRTRFLKKQLIAEFGEKAVAKGSGNIRYAVNRLMTPRIARLPKVGV